MLRRAAEAVALIVLRVKAVVLLVRQVHTAVRIIITAAAETGGRRHILAAEIHAAVVMQRLKTVHTAVIAALTLAKRVNAAVRVQPRQTAAQTVH